MPVEIKNCVADMWEQQGKTVNSFGKDQTQTITYDFNRQGFRSKLDYNWIPKTALFGCSLVMGIGVDQSKITSAYFDDCQNYGLAGRYTNQDILHTIENFINTDLYDSNTKMAVVWTDRDINMLDKYYMQLKNLNIVHFFCGPVISNPRCYKFIPWLDADVSNTHPGVLTHKTFYKILCSLFNQ